MSRTIHRPGQAVVQPPIPIAAPVARAVASARPSPSGALAGASPSGQVAAGPVSPTRPSPSGSLTPGRPAVATAAVAAGSGNARGAGGPRTPGAVARGMVPAAAPARKKALTKGQEFAIASGFATVIVVVLALIIGNLN